MLTRKFNVVLRSTRKLTVTFLSGLTL